MENSLYKKQVLNVTRNSPQNMPWHYSSLLKRNLRVHLALSLLLYVRAGSRIMNSKKILDYLPHGPTASEVSAPLKGKRNTILTRV